MRKRRASSWSYEEKQNVISDYQNGMPIEIIASKYKFTVHQIYSFLTKACTIDEDNFEIPEYFARLLQYSDFLTELANGQNPITGEEFSKGTLDQPEIIRALYSGANALRNSAMVFSQAYPSEQNSNQTKKAVNAGNKWSEQDDKKLIEAYNKGESIKKLAISFGRTEKAIAMRIERILERTSAP